MAERALVGPHHTPHHPRWLRRHASTWWWLARWSYFWFILRELSSLFVAWFVIYLLLLVRAVSQDQLAYSRFMVYNVGAGIAWVGIFIFGGYYFGNLPAVKNNFTIVIGAIIVISMIPPVIEFIRQRTSKR